MPVSYSVSAGVNYPANEEKKVNFVINDEFVKYMKDDKFDIELFLKENENSTLKTIIGETQIGVSITPKIVIDYYKNGEILNETIENNNEAEAPPKKSLISSIRNLF